jgi:uncharacterized phiE125 gp8 family phage protein
MILRFLSAPLMEPITLADVQRQTRIDDLSSESVEIDLFIQAVRQRAESVTRRALMTQQWEATLNEFPPMERFPQGRGPLQIPLPPLKSVEAIIYTDPAGVEQTMDPASYRVITDIAPNCQPGFVVPVYGACWPATLDDIGVIRVQFTAGYGNDPGDVPAGIRQWLLLNIASLYENRESATIAAGRLTEVDLSTLADSLLADFRIYGW